MRLDGTGTRLLLRVPAAETLTASWARDSRQVVVSEQGDREVRHWLCDPETGVSRRLEGGQ
jgi:hypothetical protein